MNEAGHADLLSVSLEEDAAVEHRALFLGTVPEHPVAWDVGDETIAALSVGRLLPGQTSYSLISTPLGELLDPAEVESIRGHARIEDQIRPGPEPLQRVMLERELRESGEVHFDLTRSEDGAFHLALLSGDTLQLWKLSESGGDWLGTGSFEVAAARPFRLLTVGDHRWIVWSDGAVARLEKGVLVPLIEAGSDRPRAIVDDKVERRVILLDSDGALRLEPDRAAPVTLAASLREAIAALLD